MANVIPNYAANYPDDVWPGDPRAPWNAREIEVYRTCGNCYGFTQFDVEDGRTMMFAVPEPWERTEGAIKAIDAVVRNCGLCLARGCVVGVEDDADNCRDWEQA